MRILICTGIFPPEAGGPATYSRLLAEELVKRGHEAKVITYSTPTLSPPYQGGEEEGVIRISRSWFKPWHYWKYYRAVKKHGKTADVLYAQDPVSSGYPTYLASRILKKPFLLKITGDYSWEQAMGRGLADKLIDEFQTLPELPKPIQKIRNIQIHVAKSADGVIVPSEYLKRLVIGWGVKEKRIRVIYNSVEPVPEIPKDQARRDLGIAENEFLILSIGRNLPWKGFGLLREVVKEIGSFPPLDGEPARLERSGGGKAGPQRSRLRGGRGGVNQIKLVILTDADRVTINKYYRAADLFVLNTGYEGFSHTILEAMSAGLPVITTNIGGNPEVIESLPRNSARGDKANGILIEYNNKLQLREAVMKLYNDPELRKQLSLNGKINLGNFSFQRMVGETEGALTQAIRK